MTEEEILDAAAAIIAKRARVLQLSRMQVDVFADGSFALRKVGVTGRDSTMYMSTPGRATLGKAWAREETR